ncbi:MAG: biotin/lipoyl-containing protein [Bacteroidota bacterium]
MKHFKFKINGNEYTVDVNGIEEDIAYIEVNGTRYEVEIDRKVKKSKTPTIVRPVSTEPPKPKIDKREGGAGHPVQSPLPGTIIAIKVKPGDIIEKGSLLMTMEAMKMENQVLADRAGVVESIMVNPGDAVLQGDVLLEII